MTTNTLGKFEGKPVIATDVVLRGTGDGLSSAMRVDPMVHKHGERVVIAIEAIVQQVRHDPDDKSEPDGDQVRVHIMKAETATILETDAAGDVQVALDAQRERIQRAKDAEEGVMRLPTDEELHAAHDAGDHAGGLVEGCADCDHERDEEAAGN